MLSDRDAARRHRWTSIATIAAAFALGGCTAGNSLRGPTDDAKIAENFAKGWAAGQEATRPALPPYPQVGSVQIPTIPVLVGPVWGTPTPPTASPETHEAAPQPKRSRRVELFLVSGHCRSSGGTAPGNPCYLGTDVGPELNETLSSDGFDVREHDYADNESDYSRLVRELRVAGTAARSGSVKIVLVGHSHGGVWTHAATRDVPTVRVDVLVDLDASSYGWALRTTPSIGDPRNAYAGPDRRTKYDLEDVVFPSVAENLEVRSGERALGGFSSECYDEQPNVAMSATSHITTWDVGTSHSEVHAAGGSTMRRVAAWVASRL